MHKIIVSIITYLLCATTCMAQLSATQVMANTIKQINAAPSIEAKFEASTDGVTTSGVLKMRSDRFSMVTDYFGVWYDGNSMWSFYKKANETSLSSPTDQELLEANPFFILNQYNNYYKPLIKSHKYGIYTLTLQATSQKAAISRAEIEINENTWMPQWVKATFANGSCITINVTDMQILKSPLPDKDFAYPASKYPGIEIIDLR